MGLSPDPRGQRRQAVTIGDLVSPNNQLDVTVATIQHGGARGGNEEQQATRGTMEERKMQKEAQETFHRVSRRGTE